jgi:hypothetical protein
LSLLRFARNFVERRLAADVLPVKDMMQAHINNGMAKEDLIQQVFISM